MNFKEIVDTGFSNLSDDQKEVLIKYANMHAKIESAHVTDFKGVTLLPTCMQIIAKVMQDKPNFNIIEGLGEDYNINISNEIDMDSIKELGMTDVITNMIELAIINESANMIIEKLGSSNIIQSVTLVKSIMHIAEKTYAPQVYTLLNFKVV